MSSSLSVPSKPPPVPEVILKAKAEVVAQAAEKAVNKGHTKGPWDQGHWANRR